VAVLMLDLLIFFEVYQGIVQFNWMMLREKDCKLCRFYLTEKIVWLRQMFLECFKERMVICTTKNQKSQTIELCNT
jgi:hypothetical protein